MENKLDENKISSSKKIELVNEKKNGDKSKSNGENNGGKGLQGKHPMKSKTIWFSISLLISSILMQYYHVNVSPAEIMQTIAVIVTILRVMTKEPLKV